MKKLDGKIAIVTGASKGIGAAIAQHFAAEGAAVVVNYASSKEAADRVVEEITNAGGKAIAIQADVSKKADVEQLFAKTQQTFGKLDILVNNAAIYQYQPLEEITEQHFYEHFNLNVLGLLFATQQAVKHFGKEGGNIVNISSIASTATPANLSVYNGTKAAVDAITKSIAKELGSRNIRVNAINPGMVETEGLQAIGAIGGDFQKQIEAQTPLGRIGQPQDIALAAAFFASSDSAWITGETLIISGGL
ncbi:MAG: glucose 1-dehydrogenase [Oscillatoriophycideae cyanobacterium NC_groundwater_1537_Pr4_S-0.65um_50_18]|nr:glucose 1-dehydrogenase [Oscillatoriophycideae cyanobacterium NC_groundwater_1537_Pr4_S-0.65um_50_18]